MGDPNLTRYFFHVRDGVLIEDPDGSELPDLAAARAFALRSARELWTMALIRDQDLTDAVIDITDASGQVVAVVPLIDALPQGLRKRLAVG